jgi:hypothetical protein
MGIETKVDVDVAKTSNNLIKGFQNEKTAQLFLFAIIFAIFAGLISTIVYFYYKFSESSNNNSSHYFISNLDKANERVLEFTKSLSIAIESIDKTNSKLQVQEEKLSDLKSSQILVQEELKDHEKRIMKIEIKGNLK